MSVTDEMKRKIKRALRGDAGAFAVLLEVGRRARVAVEHKRERGMLSAGSFGEGVAELLPEFARMSADSLLKHFRTRTAPVFLPGFAAPAHVQATLQRRLFPSETRELIEQAQKICDQHCWPLLGYAAQEYGAEIDWLRDPVSGIRWPESDYHADIEVIRRDGSDARVLWELNRLAHLITLGLAYTTTDDERFSVEFFAHIEGWQRQNRVGRGANWMCAMEAALRVMNLLGAFQLFRRSTHLDTGRLALLIKMFDEHGGHIERNLEFSYLATSNHYLSNVVGLLWLGVMMPELAAAGRWREAGLREMLREMDKQILADGADVERSTGYHRFVLELLLYSFILCQANGIEIAARYWTKLRAMLTYVRAYLRPDGRGPILGDTDSGQVLPIVKRTADDHAYVLAVGAAVFNEPGFRLANCLSPPELLWMMGERGLRIYSDLTRDALPAPTSSAFTNAGTYFLRQDDLYLCFTAAPIGLGGRGSHNHNDALSLEVAAGRQVFIVDPGSYVYTADLRQRQLFRSTRYHSTVEIDEAEQNTIDEHAPFVIGSEARPQVLRFETTAERDLVIAEHYGYTRLAAPVTHRRAVLFDKERRYWLVEDALLGSGTHTFRFRFHTAADLEVSRQTERIVELRDKINNARLLIGALDAPEIPSFELTWISRDYGAKTPSQSVCWTVRATAPLLTAWALVPVCADADNHNGFELIKHLQKERQRNF